MLRNTFHHFEIYCALLLAAAISIAGQAQTSQQDQEIKNNLSAPPLFLDEQHPGPTMVPKDLPNRIFPGDCRASQAYLHRVRPGEYHFQRAQRLLGQGIDVIWCEAFGLKRFGQENPVFGPVDQAVLEAEAAAASPFGTEQWRPGALKYVLMSAYEAAAKAYLEQGKKEHSTSYLERGNEYNRKLVALEKQPNRQESKGLASKRLQLLTAVLHNDPNEIERLLSAGAAVNALDSDHTSAVRVAVVAAGDDTVGLLLSKGAQPDIVDEEGVTALMDACSMGRGEVAIALIGAGANVNARANDGATPLLAAVGHISLNESGRESRRALVQNLIAKGASLNVSDWEGVTPLIAAARTADAELVSTLLTAGADIEASDEKGRTPLLEAIDKDNVEIVKLLLSKHARIAVFDKGGNSPLIMAAGRGYPEGVQTTKLLLDSGADPNLANSGGWTPLMSAEGFIYREPWGVSSHVITKELLARGADANARSKTGKTPLIAAAGQYNHDDPSFLQELINAGADVNAADADGETALMAAAERGHIFKVKLLLDSGANVNARDKSGKTALPYARQPKNDKDDDFPQCYEALSSDTLKPTNDCEGTRKLLKQASSRPASAEHLPSTPI